MWLHTDPHPQPFSRKREKGDVEILIYSTTPKSTVREGRYVDFDLCNAPTKPFKYFYYIFQYVI